ncbi:glycerol kinase GlpK [Alcaligenes sp. SDU_A2]|uniref:glycerol kinase GlpK n=1 Tax=Alcaligenes sp. SDU_A2 TaxID=3136634 RepID=UPI00311DB877
MTFILALDQGTSSSRSLVVSAQGQILAQAQQETRQYFPHSDWVEHDPQNILDTQLDTARQALRQAGLTAADISAIGITNQRETTLLWDRRTGQALHPAIVWQDRRAEDLCARLRAQGQEAFVTARTGLPIDAYFSASKLRWLLDSIPGARERAQRGELAFGTVDSWLIWHLTAGAVHATDISNASRTLLFNIHAQQWDAELLALFDIPAAILPQVRPSAHHFGDCDPALLGGPIPICGVAGDQQSALFGQACTRAGMAKNTYGTGCFLLMHCGSRPPVSHNGLIGTCAARHDDTPAYALEGSVFIGGAVVQWMRDGLGAFEHSAQVEALARSVPDAQGVHLVPAFTGLGAPYWDAQARGAITGLTRSTTMAHIARAALDSIAYQSAAVLQAMNRDVQADEGQPLQELRVDGGACANNLLMQFQADLLGLPVVRPANIETTALGAAYLAGLGVGLYKDLNEIAALWRCERIFEPTMSRDQAQTLMLGWEQAVRQARAH